ncbi:ankyrin repeat and SOCS box protein 7-like [Gigantopelta aegis]|uniref:ankyrin repeat and SOCS box protein 7-like n=1 Tax=Gigantopelta aegis TaxID=1735272 RepID=UPI001B88A68D|nr:ankyrin repeat and SOCS box protein 7-like [Gigantopelta aegis]
MQDLISLLDAVKSGSVEEVFECLKNPFQQNELNAALCWAARLGHVRILSLLLEHGADVRYDSWGGISPLLWAAIFSPDVGAVSLLIQYGSDVNHKSSKRRQTALHAAAIRGRHDMVSVLLEVGANPDMVDHLHKTPLLYAVQRCHVACIKILLQHNCDVDISGLVNGQLTTPLIFALVQNDLEMTKMLIFAGARFENLCTYQMYNISQYYQTVERNLNIDVRPVHLQQQCRVCLRHILKPHFVEKLKMLPLPKPLKDYIALSELSL